MRLEADGQDRTAVLVEHEVDRRGREWIAANCPEIQMQNVIITQKGLDKWLELNEGDILIDDKKENLECLDGTIPEAKGILFVDADSALIELNKMLENS